MITSNDSVKGVPARGVFAPDQKHNQSGTKFDLSLHDTRMKSCTRTTVSFGLNSGMTCMGNEMSFRVSCKHKQRNIWRWNELVPGCMSFWYVNSPPETRSCGTKEWVVRDFELYEKSSQINYGLLRNHSSSFFESSRNDTHTKKCYVGAFIKVLTKNWRYQMKKKLTRGKIAKKTNNAKPDKKPSIAPLTKALSSRTAGEIGKCKAGVRGHQKLKRNSSPGKNSRKLRGSTLTLLYTSFDRKGITFL